MVREDGSILIPLDGSVKVEYTKGGSVVADGVVIPGRYSYEMGHPRYPDQMCITIKT